MAVDKRAEGIVVKVARHLEVHPLARRLFLLEYPRWQEVAAQHLVRIEQLNQQKSQPKLQTPQMQDIAATAAVLDTALSVYWLPAKARKRSAGRWV